MVISTSRYVLAYLLWAISVVIAFVALLASRSSVMITLGVTQWDRYFEHALNQFGFLFLAIFGLAVIIFTEHFYRTGVEKQRLFARFFFITFLELLFLSIIHTARLAGEVLLGLFTPITLAWVGGEIALCLLLFWLYRRAVAPTIA
jgi:hypothetical protein